jgi:hypothetical protein
MDKTSIFLKKGLAKIALFSILWNLFLPVFQVDVNASYIE